MFTLADCRSSHPYEGARSVQSALPHEVSKFCNVSLHVVQTIMACAYNAHAAMQGELEQKGVQLQNQVAVNQQLMKRKEDMEWQLMSVLSQVCAC